MNLLITAFTFFVLFVVLIYTARHFIFTLNRAFAKQKRSYHDLIDSEMPSVSVIVPMHNEEAVVRTIMDLLINNGFEGMDLEIIAINDHSSDKTGHMIEEYAAKYAFVKTVHRSSGARGKPAALNDALQRAKGEIILVFDADYLPPKGMLRRLAVCFKDPEIAAVMGRVVPINEKKNLLTSLIGLERCGGYQIDQQARFNMDLLPQYGGTVGGFRKDVVQALGGFDVTILAEDTDLTMMLALRGWKTMYLNAEECREQAPEEWSARARQIERWSEGHNAVLIKQAGNVMRSDYLNFWQKVDAYLMLFVYTVPVILLLGMFASLVLFFTGHLMYVFISQFALFIMAYYGFGNFAPYYQICVASILDREPRRMRMVPFLGFKFFFALAYSTKGFLKAIVDRMFQLHPAWHKTKRYVVNAIPKQEQDA